jgi:hypothetical protein
MGTADPEIEAGGVTGLVATCGATTVVGVAVAATFVGGAPAGVAGLKKLRILLLHVPMELFAKLFKP